MSFRGKYPGRCADCGEAFPIGAEIEFNADDKTVHAGSCPEPEPTDMDLRPGERPCASCYLVHRGDCY